MAAERVRVRPLGELLDPDENGLKDVRNWASEAIRSVEWLPGAPEAGEQTLHWLQITTRSPMGALACSTGGLLVDEGWVRVLGSGCERLNRGLRDWNQTAEGQRFADGLLVGDDAVGGMFAVDTGKVSGNTGEMLYFAQDTLEWEPLELGYSDWLWFLFTGDLETFYADWRWNGWRADIEKLSPDATTMFTPPLIFEAESLEARHRGSVPMEEHWSFSMKLQNEIGDLPSGAQVILETVD